MEKLDWNYERYRTRDLLLEYDTAIMPPHPRAGGLIVIYPWGSPMLDNVVDMSIPHNPHTTTLSMIYPWENTSLNILNHQLYLIAVQNGFDGTEEDFKELFKGYVGPRSIMFATYGAFPERGITDKLYFDLETKILYYWNEEYIPVNAMLIAETALDGGEA